MGGLKLLLVAISVALCVADHVKNMLAVVISSGGLLKVADIYIACVLPHLQRLKSVLFTLLVDSFLYLFKTFFVCLFVFFQISM